MATIVVTSAVPTSGAAASQVQTLLEASGHEVSWLSSAGVGFSQEAIATIKACDTLLVVDTAGGGPDAGDGCASLIALGVAMAKGKPALLLTADSPKGETLALARTGFASVICWSGDYGPQLLSALASLNSGSPSPFRARQQRSDVEGVLEDLRREIRPHKVEVRGMPLTVLPGVLSPRLSHAPDALMDIWDVPQGGAVLDLGCGSGVLGLAALAAGAGSLIALDINPQAVANTALNLVDLNYIDRGEARLSDAYSALDAGERFDMIIFAAPYWNRTPTDDLDRSCYDEDYRFFKRAVGEMPQRLRPGGRTYILFSDQGDVGRAIRIIEDSGLRIADMHLQRPTQMGGHIRIIWDLQIPAPAEIFPPA